MWGSVDDGDSPGVRVRYVLDIGLPRNESLTIVATFLLCLGRFGVFRFSVFLVEGALVFLRFANATLWTPSETWSAMGLVYRPRQ